MFNYFLLCVISWLAGQGVLWILRIRAIEQLDSFLAPVVCLAVWILFLDWGVEFHQTVSALSPVLWGLTALLSVLGIFKLFLSIRKRKTIPAESNEKILLLALSSLLPIIVMAPYFYFDIAHFTGSAQLDAWSYVANAKYLWSYPIHYGGGELTPVYQLADSVSGGRLASSELLAFLSPIVGGPGDTLSSSGLLLAWDLFVFSTACIFFSKINVAEKTSWIFVLFSTGSILIYGSLLDNNYDNLLILGLFPALAGFMQTKAFKHNQMLLIPAAFLAVMILSYVEMAPFLILGFFVLFGFEFLKHQHERKELFIRFLVVLIISAAFVYKRGQDTLLYFRGQLNSAQQAVGARSGDGQHIAAFAQHPFDTLISHLGWGLFLVGLLCFLLVFFYLIVGSMTQWKRKNYSAVVLAAAFLAIAFYFLFFEKYPYGAYKILLFTGWLLSFILLSGILKYSKRYGVPFLCLWVLASIIGGWYAIHRVQHHFMPDTQAKHFYLQPLRDFDRVSTIIGKQSVDIRISNQALNLWPLYFLDNKQMIQDDFLASEPTRDDAFKKLATVNRDQITYLLSNQSLAQPALIRQRVVHYTLISAPTTKMALQQFWMVDHGEASYLLTDSPLSNPSFKLVWSNEFYFLWKRIA